MFGGTPPDPPLYRDRTEPRTAWTWPRAEGVTRHGRNGHCRHGRFSRRERPAPYFPTRVARANMLLPLLPRPNARYLWMADGDVFEMQIEIGVGVAADGVVLFDDIPQVPVDERVERVDVMAVQAARFQVLPDQVFLVAEHFDHFVGRTRPSQSFRRSRRKSRKPGGDIVPRFGKHASRV